MKIIYRFLSLLLLVGCKTSPSPVTPVPTTAQVSISYETLNQELQISVKNHVKTPVRLWVSIEDPELNELFDNQQPIVLKASQDTLITIPNKGNFELKPDFKLEMGDPENPVVHSPAALPLKRYRPIKILQGHHGTYSHNDNDSRYAIDFALKLRDTVYSASNGYVVQMIEDYKYGGKDRRWMDMANRIVVFDPESGRFFQYSHLFHRGSFVEQGDKVEQGQPIGLSGNTGFSDTPHLHFNVMIPSTSTTGFVSVPVDFIDGFKGEDLRKGVFLEQEKQ